MIKLVLYKTIDIGAGVVATAGNYLLSSSQLLVQSIWAPAGAFTAFLLNAIVFDQAVSNYRKAIKLNYSVLENIDPYVKWPRRWLVVFMLLGLILSSMYAGAYGKDIEAQGVDQPTRVSSYNNMLGILSVALPHIMRFILQGYYEWHINTIQKRYTSKKIEDSTLIFQRNPQLSDELKDHFKSLMNANFLLFDFDRRVTFQEDNSLVLV